MTAETKFRLATKEPHIVSIILLSAFAAMGAVLMTPALPAIAQYFKVSMGTAQLTVSTFLLGYALGQLIYGPIANRVGRKPAFYIGIAIATVGSLFSILASPVESFHLLILGRLLEALGSSVGLVVCFTIINDFYYPEQSRKIIAFMMLAFAIVPGVATAVGGLLTQYVDWQSCFYFLLLYGFILIYPAVRLPETIIQRDPHALRSHYLLKKYFQVCCNRNFIAYSLIFGLSVSFLYLFGTEGPFIGIYTLHLQPAEYGMFGLIPFVGSALGSIFVINVSKHFNATQLLWCGFVCEIIATLCMFMSFLLGHISLVTLLLPMALLLFGHALVASNVSALTMAQTDDKANGSAMMSFITMGMAVVSTFILGIMHISSPIILPTLFMVIMIAIIFIYFFMRKK